MPAGAAPPDAEGHPEGLNPFVLLDASADALVVAGDLRARVIEMEYFDHPGDVRRGLTECVAGPVGAEDEDSAHLLGG